MIRLQGTNVDEAQKLIQASGFRMIVVDDLEEAATKAVAVASIVQQVRACACACVRAGWVGGWGDRFRLAGSCIYIFICFLQAEDVKIDVTVTSPSFLPL